MITRRPYEAEADIYAMQALNAAAIAEVGHCGYLHTGDIPHRIFNGMRKYDARDIVHLWQDETGRLAAWLVVYPSWALFDYQVRPEHRGAALEEEVVDFAVAEMRKHPKPEKEDAIGVDVYEGDTTCAHILASRGFKKPEKPFIVNTARSLNDPIPNPELPPGFSIRCPEGVHEAAALIDVHSSSFGSKWTAPEYERVMRSAGYAIERERLVVAPDGRFAAFCVIWPDEVNRVGLFEPVGTHADFRRMGLARALMYDSMHRMRAMGLVEANVCHEYGNEASTALYHNLGFWPRYNVYTYALPY
jgi:ribosomal protein S18 acetylase RimI-like enzyme